MVKVLGTDSGTKSYDIFGFDDETGEVFADESIPRDEMVKDPSIVLKRLKQIAKLHRVDVIVASSGYGIPLKLARETTYEEIALATFISERDALKGHRILGLRRLLKMIKEDPDLNSITYFTPGVVQLPTVPAYRKLNRIDLGTSDKVYTAALALARHAELYGCDYSQANLIAVEIGFAYTSALAIRNGEIVDAMAGTAGFPSYLGAGHLDGETVYAISNIAPFSKEMLFRGGVAYLSGLDPFKTSIEMFVEMGGVGYEAMIESIVKDVLVLLASTTPQTVYLSGRFTRVDKFVRDLTAKFEEVFSLFRQKPKVSRLSSRGRIAKEAAEGAAIIASGLAGGRYRKLVDTLRLRESRGTIFDYITLYDRDELLKAYSIL